MSGKAFGWAREQTCSGGMAAKAVLLLMADYADREHQAFPSVSTLAEELQASERTIQRAIVSLEDDDLIVRQLRTTASGKSTSSRYLLSVDRAREGCHSVTPMGDALSPSGVSQCHPHPVTLSPSTTLEPLKGTEESADALSSARDGFDRVSGEWSKADPDRVAPPVDWRAWQRACGNIEPRALEAAALRYLAESGDVKRRRCKAFAVWLAEERWVGWLGEPPVEEAEPAPAPRQSFEGPAEFMAALHAAKDRDWIASWLGLCGWDGEAAAIVCPMNTIAETLKRDLRRLLEDFKISVIVRKAAA